MSTDICKHCKAERGLHHFRTLQCPVGGREARVGESQEWMSVTFEAGVDYEEAIRRRDQQIDLLEKQVEANRKIITHLREIITDLVFRWDLWMNRSVSMRRKDWLKARKAASK